MSRIPEVFYDHTTSVELLDTTVSLLNDNPADVHNKNTGAPCADPEVLSAACRAILNGTPTISDLDRVIAHLRDDDFDFESNNAAETLTILTFYRARLLR